MKASAILIVVTLVIGADADTVTAPHDGDISETSARGVEFRVIDLVGGSIGRMQGDYRFSFILPMRSEMLRNVPASDRTKPVTVLALIAEPGH